MMLSDALLEQIIEGALLASGQTLSVDRIQNLFEEGQEPEKERILIILERIGEKCENKGYELKKVATGYRFQVKQDIAKWVSRLWEEKPQRYSRALLETLSIIAYRQPVTRGEIEDVRGVAVSSHITKTLVEREWIQVVGHRDVPGRPAMYATTKMFLDYFNLESLDQLPTLEEIQEMVPNFEYIPTLSREAVPGIATGYVHEHYLKLIDEMDVKPLVYFCGWNRMIEEGRRHLAERGFEMVKDIRVEIFG